MCVGKDESVHRSVDSSLADPLPLYSRPLCNTPALLCCPIALSCECLCGSRAAWLFVVYSCTYVPARGRCEVGGGCQHRARNDETAGG